MNLCLSRINCNWKSQTIEEIAGRRKREVVGMRPCIKQDCLRDWGTMKALLMVAIPRLEHDPSQSRGDTFPDWEHRFDDDQVQEELRLENFFKTLAKEQSVLWFNDDGNYSEALQDGVDFRRVSIVRLFMSVIYDKRSKAHSLDGKIYRLQTTADLSPSRSLP